MTVYAMGNIAARCNSCVFFFVAVVLVLLGFGCFASFASAEEFNPRELGWARLNISQTWILEFGAGAVAPPEVFFETYYFPQTPFQRVSLTTSPQAEETSDKLGNARLHFSFKPGYQKRKKIELNAVAEVNYVGEVAELLAPGDEARYLSSTELTAPSAEIKTLAQALARDAIDDYDALARLTEWVKNNVEYDASYWKRAVPAATVLSEKRGVCNQFATLLISLLHARGIPARFAAGLVFSGESWGPHAWVEAGVLSRDGVRRWLPVDPTFGEAGILDAGHVKFAHGLDQNDVAEVATASVNVVKGEPRVRVDEKRNFDELFEVALNAPSVVGAGSAEEVAIAVKSKASEPVLLPFLVLAPSQPSSLAVRVADGELRLLYLRPGEEKAASWQLVFPSDLREDYAYNFTVGIQGLGKKISTTVQGKAGAESRKLQKLTLSRFNARDEGEREAFSIVVSNEGNTAFDAVDVIGEFNGIKQRESFSLAPGEGKLVAFSFVKPATPGVYSGSFKARDAVSGASAEQPFQLEITAPQEAGGVALPSLKAWAASIPSEYVVYAAALILAAAIVFGIARSRRALG
ncbi:MAG: transglutaminase-like domain-containing protein [Candidatus Norongarragalinales archaeon]